MGITFLTGLIGSLFLVVGAAWPEEKPNTHPARSLRENDLAIPAYDMSIEAMTVKLSWLLAQKMKYEDIKQKMVEDMHGEITLEQELI